MAHHAGDLDDTGVIEGAHYDAYVIEGPPY